MIWLNSVLYIASWSLKSVFGIYLYFFTCTGVSSARVSVNGVQAVFKEGAQPEVPVMPFPEPILWTYIQGSMFTLLVPIFHHLILFFLEVLGRWNNCIIMGHTNLGR